MRFASEGHTLKSAGWRLTFSEVLDLAQIISGDDRGFCFRVGRLFKLRIQKQEPEFPNLQRWVKS
jgi:hypothetical protein